MSSGKAPVRRIIMIAKIGYMHVHGGITISQEKRSTNMMVGIRIAMFIAHTIGIQQGIKARGAVNSVTKQLARHILDFCENCGVVYEAF